VRLAHAGVPFRPCYPEGVDARRDAPFDTLTHARLRARQGDLPGARRVLRQLLERDPADPAAHALLRDLDPPRARAARLRRWLERIVAASRG